MYFRLLFLIFMIAISALFAPSSANATEVDKKVLWSFEKHPHPGIYDLTVPELDALDRAKHAKGQEDSLCEYWFPLEYQIYLDRYPAYEKLWDKRERLRRWRLHMAENDGAQFFTCIYMKHANELIALASTGQVGDDFEFCAGFSREPQNKTEAKIKELLFDLFTYANFGRQKAVNSITMVFAFVDFIAIPTEVSYYFAVLIHELHPHELSAKHAERYRTDVSVERQSFIHAAVKRRDFHAILETHPPCAAF